MATSSQLVKRVLAGAALAGLAVLVWLALRQPRSQDVPAWRSILAGAGRGPAALADSSAPGRSLAPEMRPNPRGLRIEEVPGPGTRRTREELARTAAAEAAFRRPRLDSSFGEPGMVPAAASGAAAAWARPAEGGTAPSVPAAPAGAAAPGAPARPAPARAAAARADAAPPEEGSWAEPTAGLAQAAKQLKLSVSAPVPAGFPAGPGPQDSLMRQILMDQRVETGVREALSGLRGAGSLVSPQAAQAAAASVLKANGLAAEPEDVQAALAMAEAPALPLPAPQALAATVSQMSAHLPDPRAAEEIARRAEKPPAKVSPPPKGALEAYARSREALTKAERDFGVKPQHVLGILGVETGWGRNTGKYPVNDTLYAIATRNPPDSSKARQASRDRAALARLHARGELGDLSIDEVRGSYAGAMGIAQFLPSSWEAYARSPQGEKRDPFDQDTAAYSAANYLYRHGYNRDVAGSIYGYNHSQEYVDKVLGLSRQIESTLDRAQAQDPK